MLLRRIDTLDQEPGNDSGYERARGRKKRETEHSCEEKIKSKKKEEKQNKNMSEGVRTDYFFHGNHTKFCRNIEIIKQSSKVIKVCIFFFKKKLVLCFYAFRIPALIT